MQINCNGCPKCSGGVPVATAFPVWRTVNTQVYFLLKLFPVHAYVHGSMQMGGIKSCYVLFFNKPPHVSYSPTN